MGFDIRGKAALVTGANRGIGKALVEALLKRGASRVWAGVRRVDALADLKASYGERLRLLQLDVTREDDVAAAAREATDVALLVNNAGVALLMGSPATDAEWLRAGRQEIEVNLFGSFAMSQAFATILARQGGGAIANIISVAGLVNFPLFLSYSTSKAALHSLTQGLRAGLRGQGTQVFGVYPGPVDTDMAARVPLEKASTAEVARATLDGLAAGTPEIFPDKMARHIGEAYLKSPKALEEEVSAPAA
jgi:NAD(P)-dependent dehydrogenase (short-subunit alcohol dehydrogenase family)